MNFKEIADSRQSCRSFDSNREIEAAKLRSILDSAVLAPSACNSQPYLITVCSGNCAAEVAKACTGMGMNKFIVSATTLLVISETPYNRTAAIGAKLKNNDYRSIDIGILSAYITAEATAQGVGSCIIGWFDESKITKLCNLEGRPRLVIALGYPHSTDKLRNKKRKSKDDLIKYISKTK